MLFIIYYLSYQTKFNSLKNEIVGKFNIRLREGLQLKMDEKTNL